MAGWHPKAAGLLAAQFLPLDQWRRHAWPVAILLLLLLPVINATFLWFEDRYLGAHFESSSGHQWPFRQRSEKPSMRPVSCILQRNAARDPAPSPRIHPQQQQLGWLRQSFWS